MATQPKVKALVLDADAAGYSGGEAVHFGGFPGVWAPGQPIAITELGFDSERDARDAVKALELPLREVSVDAGSAPMPERSNHHVSEADAATAPTSEAEATAEHEAAEPKIGGAE